MGSGRIQSGREEIGEKVLSIVLLHIELNKIVNIEKLKKELNGEL